MAVRLHNQDYSSLAKESLSLKDLAVCVWACARLKVPRDCELAVLLNKKAQAVLLTQIESQFEFEFQPKKEPAPS